MGNNKFDFGYLYNDSFNEKEFIKAVLKYIKDDSSPSYIFDEMKMGKVSRINVPLILTGGTSEIEYSRLIGYDTIETTTKYRTSPDGNTKRSTYSRTITNWKKDSGIISGTSSSGYFDNKYKIYDEYITNHVMDKNNIRRLNDDELDKYNLDDEIINYLKNDILNKVFKENITYPGNHIKNETYSGTTELFDTTLTIISLYSVEITIKDKSITFIASTNGDIEIKMFGEYPLDNYEETFKFTKEITSKRKEATKKPRALAKYTILSTIILFILLLVLGISLNILALTIISIVILILGLIITIKFSLDIKKISKPYYNQIREYNINNVKNKQKIKEEGYQNYLNNNL